MCVVLEQNPLSQAVASQVGVYKALRFQYKEQTRLQNMITWMWIVLLSLEPGVGSLYATFACHNDGGRGACV